jgi:ferredoxin-type protein NapF
MRGTVDYSRRGFLKARPQTTQRPPRLPWIRSESTFLDGCTQCGACIKACETQIIVKGEGGFPQLDFSKGECTFCHLCVQACDVDMFTNRDQRPWDYRAFIADTCLNHRDVLCQSCKEICEPRAIIFHYSENRFPVPAITNENCTARGACVSICPVSAISINTETYEANT